MYGADGVWTEIDSQSALQSHLWPACREDWELLTLLMNLSKPKQNTLDPN